MMLLRSVTIEAAATSLAAQVAAALRKAMRERGRASLLVPGGRTPVPLFRALRRHELPWDHVTVGLTDERWVPSDHADSNARLVCGELLAEAAARARFQPLFNAASTASAGAAESWRAMQALPRPFDAVVLGMGDDGHFASLFPGSPGLAAALDAQLAPGCVAMQAPVPPRDRVSLNLAALADARQLFLFITGERKRALLDSAGTRAALPVDALLALRHPRPLVCWAP